MSKIEKLKNTPPLKSHWRREYSLFQAISIADGLQKVLIDLFGGAPTVRVEGSKGWISIFSPAGSVEKWVEVMMDRLQNDPTSIEADMKSLQETGEHMVAVARQFENMGETNSYEELTEAHKQFYDAWVNHVPDLWHSFYYAEAGGRIFEQVLKQHVPDDKMYEAVSALSQPAQKAHVLRIADYFGQHPDSHDRLEFIKREYPWILATDIYTTPPTDKQLSDFVESFNSGNSSESSVDDFGIPPADMERVKIYQQMLYLKDKRDEYRRHAFYLMRNVVSGLAGHLSLEREDLWYIFPDEFLKARETREELLDKVAIRKQGYLLQLQKDEIIFLAGEDVFQYFVKEESEETLEVKGVTGSPGIVRGKVQIVSSTSDIQSFGEGNVLVATTTNPDYVPAMKRAAAFVTDEGGITSHAAIVAREMRKPCIVGTKNATKILSDGDQVEVDANTGVVKKL